MAKNLFRNRAAALTVLALSACAGSQNPTVDSTSSPPVDSTPVTTPPLSMPASFPDSGFVKFSVPLKGATYYYDASQNLVSVSGGSVTIEVAKTDYAALNNAFNAIISSARSAGSDPNSWEQPALMLIDGSNQATLLSRYGVADSYQLDFSNKNYAFPIFGKVSMADIAKLATSIDDNCLCASNFGMSYTVNIPAMADLLPRVAYDFAKDSAFTDPNNPVASATVIFRDSFNQLSIPCVLKQIDRSHYIMFCMRGALTKTSPGSGIMPQQ